MAAGPAILKVGDSTVVAKRGRVTIDRITVCLQPTTDPAGELHAVAVEAIELSEYGPTFVVSFGDHWAYGIEVDAGAIKPAAVFTVEVRGPRRAEPERVEEERTDLSLSEAVDAVDDLAGVQDREGIEELEPTDNHVYTDDETGDEVEVRRES